MFAVFLSTVWLQGDCVDAEMPGWYFCDGAEHFPDVSRREQAAEEQEHRDHTFTAELNLFFSAEACTCR